MLASRIIELHRTSTSDTGYFQLHDTANDSASAMNNPTNRFRFLPALLALVFLSSSAVASEPEAYVLEGITHMYNVEFDQAAASFDKAIEADPDDPIGYFFRANVHLWSYLFDRRPEQLQYYMNSSDQAIRVAEKRLSSNGDDSEAALILGMTHGYRSIAHAREENFMAAALSAKTCYEQLNDLVRSDRKQYDAYLGLGLFHFFFGAVPKAAQFVAGMSGIKGDAMLGIREIEAAAAKGKYFKQDAQLVLALLSIYYEQDHKGGLKILSSMADKYPRNVALLYAIGSAYLDLGDPGRAVTYYNRVIKQANDDFLNFTTMSYGRIGIAYFRQNDFARAKPYLQKFIKYSPDRTLRSYAWYLLGICYEMGGNRTNAVKSYNRVVESPWTAAPEDQTAKRRAPDLAERAMSTNDKDIIRLMNLAETMRGMETVKFGFKILVRKNASNAEKAQAYYAIGRGYMDVDKYDEAIKAFRKAIELRGHAETWVDPFSYYYMAEAQRKSGDKASWRKNIDRARDFDGYDNELKLRFLIERDVTTID
jgi:tetratricopeptide (TPR) repeat protein